jgi:hypothetical protein
MVRILYRETADPGSPAGCKALRRWVAGPRVPTA